MLDVVALGELLIDFTCQNADGSGYPTMAAHPGGAPANFLFPYVARLTDGKYYLDGRLYHMVELRPSCLTTTLLC